LQHIVSQDAVVVLMAQAAQCFQIRSLLGHSEVLTLTGAGKELPGIGILLPAAQIRVQKQYAVAPFPERRGHTASAGDRDVPFVAPSSAEYNNVHNRSSSSPAGPAGTEFRQALENLLRHYSTAPPE